MAMFASASPRSKRIFAGSEGETRRSSSRTTQTRTGGRRARPLLAVVVVERRSSDDEMDASYLEGRALVAVDRRELERRLAEQRLALGAVDGDAVLVEHRQHLV